MASGVKVSDECKAVYDRIKIKKDYRYVVFNIIGEMTIEVENTGNRDTATYEEFLQDLQVTDSKGNKGCRYGLYDFVYTHTCQGTTEGKKEKLFLMLWCPDDSKVKLKMMYSSSFDALKKALVGVRKYIQMA